MRLKLFLGFDENESVLESDKQLIGDFLANSQELSDTCEQVVYSDLLSDRVVDSLKEKLQRGDLLNVEAIILAPYTYLAANAVKGIGFSESKESWLSLAKGLIRLFKCARSRVNVSFSEMIDGDIAKELQCYMASMFIEKDIELTNMVNYVAACCHEPEATKKKLFDEVELINKLQSTMSESTDTLRELFRLQEVLESKVVENQKLNQKILSLEKKVEKDKQQASTGVKELKTYIATLEHDNSNVEVERKDLLNALMTVQEALEDKMIRLDRSIEVRHYQKLQLQNQWISARNYQAIKELKRKDKLFSKKAKRQARKIMESSVFDPEWYAKTYTDVANSNMDAAEHYILFGAVEGRNPSESFDTLYYISHNQDVAQSGINPLIHYIDHGMAEGRAPMSYRR